MPDLDTDADRLAMLRGLGAQQFSCVLGSFWALFDAEDSLIETQGAPVESRETSLYMRTSDAVRFGLDEHDVDVWNAAGSWTTTRHAPADDFSRVFLRER